MSALRCGYTVALMLLIALTSGAQELRPELDAVLQQMPPANAAARRAAFDALLAQGPAAITELCKALLPAGDTDNSKVRFALHGLAMYVNRESAGSQRRQVAAALADGLGQATDPQAKRFLVAELQWIGGAEAVPKLAPLLQDRDLVRPVARTLTAIGGATAVDALRAALPKLEGSQAAPVVKALGALRAHDAADAIAAFANHPDSDLRSVALYALAEIGAPASRSVLRDRLSQSRGYARNIAYALYIRYARQLAEDGNRDAAAAVCREVLDADALPPHVRCQALGALADCLDADAAPTLLAALDSPDTAVRQTAATWLARLPGNAVTDCLLAILHKAAPPMRARILRILGERGDPAITRAVLPELRHDALEVRQAAVAALSQLSGSGAARPLIAALNDAGEAEKQAIVEALGKIEGDDASEAVAASLADAPPASQAMLLDVLASRRATAFSSAVADLLAAPQPPVRLAAARALQMLGGEAELPKVVARLQVAPEGPERSQLSKTAVAMGERIRDPARRSAPVLAALADAAGPTRLPLIQLLPRLGGADALAYVFGQCEAPDPELREAAIRALTEWSEPNALPLLRDLVANAETPVHRVLAIRGSDRLLRAAELPPAQKVEHYGKLIGLAERPEGRQLLLSGLAEVPAVPAFQLAAHWLDNADAAEAAAVAVGAIGSALATGGGLSAVPDARSTVAKAMEAVTAAATRDQLAALLNSLPDPDNPNLALGRPVKTSVAHQGPHVPQQAVDGRVALDSGWWGARHPSWFQVDLGESYPIDLIHVFFYWDGSRYYQYRLEVSTDGKAWQQVADESETTTPCTPEGKAHTFPPVQARYVRLNILRNSANEAVHVIELKVFAAGRHAAAPALPKTDAEGFVPLFNGKDLTGWVGDTVGYIVRDGTIVCIPGKGRNLMTEAEYDNFVLRFEFKLTPGANNGLGIRAPLTGNAAYAGYELQILDNTAEKYNALKPYQYHGSIYGLVPAKRGYLKPVGEWNQEEVLARGGQITVILNGTTIVDADVSQYQRPTRGHIGFLGHGDEVAFRNIRIRRL